MHEDLSSIPRPLIRSAVIMPVIQIPAMVIWEAETGRFLVPGLGRLAYMTRFRSFRDLISNKRWKAPED